MDKLTDPHDKFFRASMQNMPVAKAFFEHYLPKPIATVLDTDSLKLENSSYINEKLQETISDMVFSCPYKQSKTNTPAKVILLIEHQSTPQRLMPFRVYHYIFNMLYRVLKERPKKQARRKLPAVFALVYYHGKQTPYPFSMNLTDCFDDPHHLMQNFLTSAVPLIDLNQEKDDELKRLQLLGIVALALKYSRHEDSRPYLRQVSDTLNSMDLSDDQALNLIKSAFNYLLSVSSAKNVQQFVDDIWRLPKPVRGEIMTIAEELEARGLQKGEKLGLEKGQRLGLEKGQRLGLEKGQRLGLEKGKEIGKEEMVINLLKSGADPKFVATMAEMELAVVLKLKAQLEAN